MRFGPPIRNNILGELSALRRTGTVAEYQKQFLALLCRVTPSLNPMHQVNLLTTGLGKPLSIDVELQNPADLQAAMSLARSYEQRLEDDAVAAPRIVENKQRSALSFHSAPAPVPAPSRVGSSMSSSAAIVASKSPTRPGTTGTRFRRLSAAEMAERREKGLCFNCPEKFSKDHHRQCSMKGIYLLEMDEGEDDDSINDDTVTISLHALTGIRTSKTMRLAVIIGGVTMSALVDSGSTHTFVATEAARRLGLSPTTKSGLNVMVANGDQVTSSGICSGIPIKIDSEDFITDCYVIPLVGYNVVLGVQWLRTLGPILWDFDKLTMSFWRDDHQVAWHGHGGDSFPPQAHALTGRDLLPELLQEFDDLFNEPSGLPPERSHDHRIPLISDTAVVAVRPYRYPQLLKDEIERQCAAMLAQGIIQKSDSEFSSPVLLVKKQDKTWHFCVDYRALNSKMIKNKYPIPVVDDLLDELKGARFFTKLDLRSGYHQVRMHPDDVKKTAFRTHHGHYEFLVMAFGLTNAPATFQALMNDILAPFLRRFVLVFFDDILIYSSSWAEHLQLVRAVLLVLQEHQMVLKRSKCLFGEEKVTYLGHIVSASGVAMDPSKVEAVAEWPQPRTVRALRGFLGLTGYYRKFIDGYGAIASPLTKLLKKEGFTWSSEAHGAFLALKKALVSPSLLQLPDFTKRFIIDCDASGVGFGAVLHQGAGPIAFFSRAVAPHHAKLAAYERELIGLVKAVRHWRPYVWGRSFTIRTNHYSLKFLLDQRLSTIPQHTWVSKLFGYDFEVEFRPGKHNGAADALSRREESAELHAISGPSFEIFDLLRQETNTLPELITKRDQIQAGLLTTGWSLVDGLVTFEGKIYVPTASACWPLLLADAYRMGHEGIQKTLHRLRASFYNPHASSLVKDYVKSCSVCQRNKTEHLHPVGLLQPLAVPSAVWEDISMDFIEGLPRVRGKSVILTVVDHFSKYAHFIALGHPYTALSVAKAFYDDIIRLHGIPCSIVSDRDPVFTSTFWKELFRFTNTKLNMSTAFHPQTDGQSEVVNRIITMYLRCLSGDHPKNWLQWLPWAEFCYNSSYQTSLRETPFKVVYGRDPPTISAYQLGSSCVVAVDK